MRTFIALLLIPVSFFVGSFFTMWLSDLIVGPYGLAGYTYQQAMGITGVVYISVGATMLINLAWAAITD